LHAPGINEQQIDAEVQDYLAVLLARAELEHGPLIRWKDLMGQLVSNSVQLRIHVRGIEAVMSDLVVRCVRENLLQSILANDRPQHVVTIDQCLPGGLEPTVIEAGPCELEVDMATDVAQLEILASPDPIGPLHIGKGERLEPGYRIRYDSCRGLLSFGGKPLRPPVFV
jgi:hypothetical protein